MNYPSPRRCASFTFAFMGPASRFFAALSIVSSGRGHGIFEAGLVAEGTGLAAPTATAALAAAGAGTTEGPGAAQMLGKSGRWWDIPSGRCFMFFLPPTIMARSIAAAAGKSRRIASHMRK